MRHQTETIMMAIDGEVPVVDHTTEEGVVDAIIMEGMRLELHASVATK